MARTLSGIRSANTPLTITLAQIPLAADTLSSRAMPRTAP
jgi:hypothetical protein